MQTDQMRSITHKFDGAGAAAFAELLRMLLRRSGGVMSPYGNGKAIGSPLPTPLLRGIS
jgi:hypothetical protein